MAASHVGGQIMNMPPLSSFQTLGTHLRLAGSAHHCAIQPQKAQLVS